MNKENSNCQNNPRNPNSKKSVPTKEHRPKQTRKRNTPEDKSIRLNSLAELKPNEILTDTQKSDKIPKTTKRLGMGQ